MNASPAPGRLQFSLRSLMLVMTKSRVGAGAAAILQDRQTVKDKLCLSVVTCSEGRCFGDVCSEGRYSRKTAAFLFVQGVPMLFVQVGEIVTVPVGSDLVELKLSLDALGLLMLQVRSTCPPKMMEIERRQGRELKTMWPSAEGKWQAIAMAHRLWFGAAVAVEVGDERLRIEIVGDGEPTAGVGLQLATASGLGLTPATGGHQKS